MEIRTKFSRGDEFYGVLKNMDYRAETTQKLKVKCVLVFCYPHITKITYKYEYYGEERYINEQDCFATKAEAQKECNRRNGTA